MEKHLDITVTGLVQGVFFRKFTKIKADELSIKGTVRNMNDGSVFIEAEGEEQNLKEFLNWCHNGPERAEVQNVSFRDGAFRHFHDFAIIR